MDPTGAPSPFEKHIERVSTHAAQSRIGTPVATAAFHRRAPSRWTRRPSPRAVSAAARSRSSGTTAPPCRLWVFSRQRSETRATWSSSE